MFCARRNDVFVTFCAAALCTINKQLHFAVNHHTPLQYVWLWAGNLAPASNSKNTNCAAAAWRIHALTPSKGMYASGKHDITSGYPAAFLLFILSKVITHRGTISWYLGEKLCPTMKQQPRGEIRNRLSRFSSRDVPARLYKLSRIVYPF
jgi:hypothetical protein